jgi:hypothetical protein
MMGTAVKRSGAVLLVAGLMAATVVWAQQAQAGASCTFEAEPESFQFRGGNITVTGSFTELPPNHDFRVVLATDFGLFGPEGEVLQPVGTTNGVGQFDHTVTIPTDHPTGDFDLTVWARESQGGLTFPTHHVCSQPYTVGQLLIVGPIVLPTTTTTLGLAQPTTSSPPETTTTVPATTTVAETTVPETTTTVAETTVPETTTTTDQGEALVASEQTGGAPGWMIVLLILMAVALAGIGGYTIARRRAGGA